MSHSNIFKIILFITKVQKVLVSSVLLFGEKMFLSVIVPVYNVEKYLSRCIDSILGQSFEDFELILINDGSLDNCPNICDQYAARDSRITVIHQKNAGVSAARNAGLNVVTGEWITFADSDDFFDKNAFEIIFTEIAKDGKIDILIFDFYLFRENKPIIPIFLYHEPFIYSDRRDIKKLQLQVIAPSLFCAQATGGGAPFKAYKKEILRGVYFPEELHINEDHLFFLRILDLKTVNIIKYIKVPLYYRTRNPEQITTRYNPQIELLLNQAHQAFEQYFFSQHANDPEFMQARLLRIVARTGEFLKLYLLKPENPLSLSEKIRKLKAFIQEYHIRDAAEEISIKEIPFNTKIGILLLRNSNSIFFYCAYWLKENIINKYISIQSG